MTNIVSQTFQTQFILNFLSASCSRMPDLPNTEIVQSKDVASVLTGSSWLSWVNPNVNLGDRNRVDGFYV
jgi:hypothetical protein